MSVIHVHVLYVHLRFDWLFAGSVYITIDTFYTYYLITCAS